MEKLWERVRKGQHSLLVGRHLVLPPAPDDLLVLRVNCPQPSQPLGPLLDARSQVEQLLDASLPLFDLAADRVKSGLRKRLLGDEPVSERDGGLVAALNRLARQTTRPCALLLDHLELADSASLEVLQEILTRPGRLRVPLVLIFRQDSVPELAEPLLRMLELTYGAQVHLEESVPAGTPIPPSAPPPDLPTLAPGVLRTLRVAGVVGARFEVELLANVLETSSLQVLEHLQEAHDAGVVVRDQGDGVLELSEALAEQLRGQLLPSLLKAWHHRLATLLSGPSPLRTELGPLPEARLARDLLEDSLPFGDETMSARAAEAPGAGDDARAAEAPGVTEEARAAEGPGASAESDAAEPSSDTQRPPADADVLGAEPAEAAPPSAQEDGDSEVTLDQVPLEPLLAEALEGGPFEMPMAPGAAQAAHPAPPVEAESELHAPLELSADAPLRDGGQAGEAPQVRGEGARRSVPVGVEGLFSAQLSPEDILQASRASLNPARARAIEQALAEQTWPGEAGSGSANEAPAAAPAGWAARYADRHEGAAGPRRSQRAAASRDVVRNSQFPSGPSRSEAPGAGSVRQSERAGEEWDESGRRSASAERGPARQPVLGAARRPSSEVAWRRPARGMAARAAGHLAAVGELEAAATGFLDAAREAANLGAFPHAIAYAQQALAQLEQLPLTEGRRRLRIDVLSSLGSFYWQSAGRGPEFSLGAALSWLEQAAQHLREDDPVSLQAGLASLIAGVCYDMGGKKALDRSQDELTRASRLLQQAGEATAAARLLNDQAAVLVRQGDPVRAFYLLTESRKVFESRVDTDPIAQAELAETDHLLARLTFHVPPRPGREADAIQVGLNHARAAEGAYRKLQAVRELARVWETRGRLELMAGNAQEALALLQRAMQTQQHLGDMLGLARSVGALAEVLATLGEQERALALLLESIQLNLEKGTSQGLEYNRQSLTRLLAGMRGHENRRLVGLAREAEQRLALAEQSLQQGR